jgi:hypothetical protein
MTWARVTRISMWRIHLPCLAREWRGNPGYRLSLSREKRAGSKALLSMRSSGFAPATTPGYVEHLPAGAIGLHTVPRPREELLQRLVPLVEMRAMAMGVIWTVRFDDPPERIEGAALPRTKTPPGEVRWTVSVQDFVGLG